MELQTCSRKVACAIDLLTEQRSFAVFRLSITQPEGLSTLDLIACFAFCCHNMQAKHRPIGHRIAPGAAIRVQDSGNAWVALIQLHQDVDGPQVAMKQAWLSDFVKQEALG